MTNTQPTGPLGGRQQYLPIPAKVHRRTLARPVYKRQSCTDNRAYSARDWTIPSTIIDEGDFGPMEKMDRDYWVARATMVVGRHDPDTHPDDGAPSGESVKANFVWIDRDDDSNVQMLLNNDARLNIPVGHHHDAVNDEEDGAYSVGDFNRRYLFENDTIYPRIIQVESGRAGMVLVMSLILVPIP